MIRVLHESRDTALPDAMIAGEALWLERADVERATGWSWKPQGLCREDTCIPLPRGASLANGDKLDLAAFWRHAGWPIVHDAASQLWVLGEGAARRAGELLSLQAPDFELPDIDGNLHRLSDYRGRRVFLATWASWCGCRADLSVWQSLYEAAKDHGFTVLAIALDQPDAARPWIDAASPTFPCLIDRDHHVAELYNLVNVPQAIWIDESGRMVRPPETAGSTDGFRSRDAVTNAVSAEILAERPRRKAAYLDAVRDWAVRGAQSPNALDASRVSARLSLPDASVAEAHARFRLGQALLRMGRAEEAAAQFATASRLHPYSWSIWRQNARKNETGLAVSPEFWERVDALADRPYYPVAELADSPPSISTR